MTRKAILFPSYRKEERQPKKREPVIVETWPIWAVEPEKHVVFIPIR